MITTYLPQLIAIEPNFSPKDFKRISYFKLNINKKSLLTTIAAWAVSFWFLDIFYPLLQKWSVLYFVAFN